MMVKFLQFSLQLFKYISYIDTDFKVIVIKSIACLSIFLHLLSITACLNHDGASNIKTI